MHQVTLSPSGVQFAVSPDETVLAAALRNGQVLPHSCKNGRCAACKARILEGYFEPGDCDDNALTAEERAQGKALLCQAKPLSDLVVEARTLAAAANLRVRKLPCRVHRIHRAADDVAIVRLKLPAGERLQLLAGQYVDFLLKDGSRRSFSVANLPDDDEGLIELHIRRVPSGAFTEHVFTVMKERDILRIDGPHGTFFLREESEKPVVFVASGTGFAPIKAVLEKAFKNDVARPMTLYWGGRRPKDLYMNELAVGWATEHARFKYVPVVSEPLREDGWVGRTGFVHHAVMHDIADLSGHEVYACGVPVMVDSARRDFVRSCRLPESEFYADSFNTQADLMREAPSATPKAKSG